MKYLFELLLGRVPSIDHFPSWFVMSLLPSWKVAFLSYIGFSCYLVTPLSSVHALKYSSHGCFAVLACLHASIYYPIMTSSYYCFNIAFVFAGWLLHHDTFCRLQSVICTFHISKAFIGVKGPSFLCQSCPAFFHEISSKYLVRYWFLVIMVFFICLISFFIRFFLDR